MSKFHTTCQGFLPRSPRLPRTREFFATREIKLGKPVDDPNLADTRWCARRYFREPVTALVGSRERMEYDFVGRTVNLAARVQTLTRTHHVDILVTEALRAELDTRFVRAPMPAGW